MTPGAVTGLPPIAQIAAGELHTCARLRDGTMRCWGSASQGQIGDGENSGNAVTTPSIALAGASGIAAGYDHVCASISDGTVRCWGENNVGQLGDGGFVTRATTLEVAGLVAATVVSGSGFSCACPTRRRPRWP